MEHIYLEKIGTEMVSTKYFINLLDSLLQYDVQKVDSKNLFIFPFRSNNFSGIFKYLPLSCSWHINFIRSNVWVLQSAVTKHHCGLKLGNYFDRTVILASSYVCYTRITLTVIGSVVNQYRNYFFIQK